jgi:hypothetical protein
VPILTTIVGGGDTQGERPSQPVAQAEDEGIAAGDDLRLTSGESRSGAMRK